MHNLRDMPQEQTAYRPRASTARPWGGYTEIRGRCSAHRPLGLPPTKPEGRLKAGYPRLLRHPGQVHFSLELTRRGRHVESYTTGRGATVTRVLCCARHRAESRLCPVLARCPTVAEGRHASPATTTSAASTAPMTADATRPPLPCRSANCGHRVRGTR
jgi:hypothetical protein